MECKNTVVASGPWPGTIFIIYLWNSPTSNMFEGLPQIKCECFGQVFVTIILLLTKNTNKTRMLLIAMHVSRLHAFVPFHYLIQLTH